MIPKNKELKKMPVDEVIEYFRKEGIKITKEEAECIMEFLYNITMMVIKKYFDKE